MTNALVDYITSLAARRAVHAEGKYIHRLLGISINKLPVSILADEAFSKLDNDLKQKFLGKTANSVCRVTEADSGRIVGNYGFLLQKLKQRKSNPWKFD